MKQRYLYEIIILFLCLFLSSCATFSESAGYYRQACQYARQENYDSAFMRLVKLLSEDPNSAYAPKAAFAIGEYYLLNSDYKDATAAFYKYIKNYSSDTGVIFAELIIYKIANNTKTNTHENINFNFKEQDLLASIRKKVFSKPVFFIFFEKKKSFSYHSIFGNVYIAFDYVDKLKVMKNEELFLELSP